MLRPLGVILAGGASTRMGRDKAFVELGGRALVDHVSEALSLVCREVVVAGRPDGIAGLTGIADTVPERRGPLAGVTAALEYAGTGEVLVVAVDQPWIRHQTMVGLASVDSSLAVVPIDRKGYRQTTCARYPTTMLSVALDELYAGGSIQSALDRSAFTPIGPDVWEGWDEDGRSWFSVDTEASLADGIARFGPLG